MKDAKNRHLNAEKHRRNADFDVGCLDAIGRFNGASGGDTGYDELWGHLNIWNFERATLDRLTVCQKDRKMTSLIATTLRNGLCAARSRLSWI